MSRAAARHASIAALLAASLLAGCASKPQSYVVLLRDPDGNLGHVVVTSPRGEQVLTEVFKGVNLDGNSTPYFVMQDQLKRDFGAALAAAPPAPATRPPLRFPSGVTALTPELQKQVQDIANAVKALAGAGRSLDLSVVGHADSTGTDAVNERTGLARAGSVANELVRLGVPREAISVEAHGNRQKLVPARPGGEEENRRVEVTIR
ncbi:MAG: OmpA family protein [Rhodoferax sp.]